MSLLLVSDPFDLVRPSRLLDILSPTTIIPREVRSLLHCPYLRRNAASNAVNLSEDRFEAHLDVQQFKPEEISVKVCDNSVVVEGKHEEKRDEHGYISRHFVRKYVLPKGHDVSKVESRLSSDGVLTITAPKIEAGKREERAIPVVQTGQPSKAVEQKQEQEEKEVKKDEKK